MVLGAQYPFSLCGCSGRAGLVTSRGIVLPNVHFFPFVQRHFQKGIATSDPFFFSAHPFGHKDGAERNSMDGQTPVGPG